MDGQVTRLPDNQNYPFDQASMEYHNSQYLRTMSDLYIKNIKSGTKRVEDFYKELDKMSVADAKSLLYTCNILSNKSWENINYDIDDYKNLLIKELRSWKLPIEKFNELLDIRATYVLPKNYVDWFKDDLRCSLFLTQLVHSMFNNAAYKGRNELMSGITNFLPYNITYFNSHANNEFGYLNRVQIIDNWKVANLLSIKSTYLKGRTQDKELKWLDISNHDQIEWAYSYLDNDKDRPVILQGVFFPETVEDKYELILAHLDTLSNIESPLIGTVKKIGFSERSYMLYKIRKAWDGRKSYGSKSKISDGNVNIYKNNQEKLETLTKLSKTTVNKLVNKYIEDAYQNLISDSGESTEKLDQYDTSENNIKANDKNSEHMTEAKSAQITPSVENSINKRRTLLKSKTTPTTRVSYKDGKIYTKLS